MNLNSISIPGLTDISDDAAENLTGGNGNFAVIFVTEDGQRIRNRVDTTSATFSIPDNIKRIRIRNRDGNPANFVVDFTDDNGSFNAGDLYGLDPKDGTVVYRGGTVRDLDFYDFTPTQITVSGQTAT